MNLGSLWEHHLKALCKEGITMKRITFLHTLLTFSLCTFLVPYPSYSQEKPTPWEVYFSPNGGCTDAIVRELDKAQSTVLVQAYSFTSYKIAKALLDAHKRGVKVEIILDKSQMKFHTTVVLGICQNLLPIWSWQGKI